MKYHIVGLPHTQTNLNHSTCAFTMKALHLAKMLVSLGHEVVHYGVEGSECPGENVTIMSCEEQEGFFGPLDPSAMYEVDWSGRAPYWGLFNSRAAAEINKRKQPGDFVCIIMGNLNLPLVEAVEGDVMIVEYGAGYNGLLPRKAGRYRVYESYAHMHKIWGAEGGFDPDGYFYDAVIPNYFDPDRFPLQTTKEDYYLYLGRLIRRKGIHIAVETCKRLGVKLKIAGQGCVRVGRNKICCSDGEVYEGDNLEFVGFAKGDKAAKLYGGAIATFMATTYVEPFGAVAVESQMAGTPVITTDFGAFPETVEHGKTGFLCHTLNEFIWAAKTAPILDPQYIHDRAVNLYSMDNVRWKYDTYFRRLRDLWLDGWYTIHNTADERWLIGSP